MSKGDPYGGNMEYGSVDKQPGALEYLMAAALAVTGAVVIPALALFLASSH
jgi:hypothetical protein